MARLRGLEPTRPQIVEVRGRGLMVGVELPSHEAAIAVEQACFHKGLLVLTCGESTLRLAPPLICTEAQADLAVALLDAALESVAP